MNQVSSLLVLSQKWKLRRRITKGFTQCYLQERDKNFTFVYLFALKMTEDIGWILVLRFSLPSIKKYFFSNI